MVGKVGKAEMLVASRLRRTTQTLRAFKNQALHRPTLLKQNFCIFRTVFQTLHAFNTARYLCVNFVTFLKTQKLNQPF
jgi:hypothetical protein